MTKIGCICFLIATAAPLWCQVEPSATGGPFSLDDTHMMTPPPLSRDAYPVVVASESRSNYLDASLGFTSAYIDNLMIAGSTDKVSDETYSFVPEVVLDRRTPRQGEFLRYSSGFTLYQNTSQYNGVSQDAWGQYRFHISPYALIQLDNRFQQNYNLYNQSNPFVPVGGSGSLGAPGTVLISPFANQLSNWSSASINYQYGRNAMIGGSGSYTLLHYTDASQVPGLNDGDTTGAIGFYSRRIAPSEYVGVAYQFSKFTTRPVQTYTLTNSVLGFYTHYFTESFSFSILAGPEHYTAWTPSVQKQESWTPAVQGSFGWEANRKSLSASFSHMVSGAEGLSGTYRANMASLNGGYLFSPTWSAGAHVEYSLLESINSDLYAYPGGHTVGGGVELQHRITERLSAEIGYGHFHQSYEGIAAGSVSPDSNRVYFSVNYGFHRPLGR
jgi:hypothetical protein